MSQREEFEAEEKQRLKVEADGRIHSCEEAGCQIDPKGKRRRNPGPGEADAAPTIPLLPKPQPPV